MRVNHILSALALALPVCSLSATAKMGCYSDLDSFKNQGPFTYQSPGYCQNECTKKDFRIAALGRGNMCYCGNKMPSETAKVDDDQCDLPCSGWPDASCGGEDAFTIIQTVENIEASASGNASATATAATAAGGIIVAPSPVASSTGIVTAASSTTSKSANAGLSKSTASGSASSSSASPTTAFNAAGTVRVGSSLIGAVVAGMGLLL